MIELYIDYDIELNEDSVINEDELEEDEKDINKNFQNEKKEPKNFDEEENRFYINEEIKRKRKVPLYSIINQIYDDNESKKKK